MKSLLEFLLMPSGLIVVLSGLALALWFLWHRKRAGITLGLVALGTYLVLGSGIVANTLIGYLEQVYPPAPHIQQSHSPHVAVVLAGFALADDRRPISGQVNSSSAFRVLEATRLHTHNSELSFIVSGLGEVPALMSALLVSQGVPLGKIRVDDQSASTFESAINLRDRLESKEFFLVTSAGHMPRAMGVFLRQGLHPIPAPTEYLSSARIRPVSYFPSARHLAISDLAIHEYIGLAWYQMTGRM